MNAITKSNVINAEEYRKMVLEVLEFSGKTICKTLGPCANSSIIEEMGPLVASKDGFHTIQRVMFSNEDFFANNVLKVIKTISHSMVSSVGDGSSSVIVAAWKFAELISNIKIRPRVLNETFKHLVDELITIIHHNAKFVPTKEIPKVMKNTALVSTNWDIKFADMIEKIYTENGSDISFMVSKSPSWNTETKMKKISGYKADRYYMIDPIFNNRPGQFIGSKVHIVCFDMSIDSYHYNMIHHIENLIHDMDNDPRTQREIIIVAPSYSQNFLDLVKRDVDYDMQLIRAKAKRHISIRYLRCLSVNSAQRNEYMDFAMLAGSNPITASDFNKMVNIMTSEENYDDEILKDAIGEVESITVNRNEYTVISGFPKLNQERFETVINHVENDYYRELELDKNRRVTTVGLYELKKRLQKLKQNIVEVEVGSDNEIEMELHYDAADDATRACESVAHYGYNIGGNMAIILACNEYKPKNEIESIAITIIKETFKRVLTEVFANKYTSDGFDSLDDNQKNEITEKINSCEKNQCYYDLINEEYSYDIINSSQTDVEILKNTIGICLTLMTANQYVTQIPVYKKK